jgi:hypothetical protein
VLPVQRWAPLQAQLKRLDPAASVSFYFAYFAVNTLFFVLTIAVLMLALGADDTLQKRLLIVFLSFLIALSQYVVTPYDNLAYFLLCAGAWLSLAPPAPGRLLVLFFVVMLGTATRETAALNISFAAAIYLLRHGFRPHRDLLTVACVVTAFVCTYLGLRCVYGFVGGIYDAGAAGRSPTTLDYLIVLMSLCLLWLLTGDAGDGRALIWLLVCASPYLCFVALFGIWRELRLWVPLILLARILAVYAPAAAAVAADEPARSGRRRAAPLAVAHSSPN